MASKTKASKTLVPGIADLLREYIWKGLLRPGEHISQAEWADQLGVSLIPLREAMRILEAEGLLEVMPNRGVRVMPVSTEEIEEWLLEFKGLLHVLLPLAVPLLTPATLARMRVLAAELDQERVASTIHLEFWNLLIAPCGKRRLAQLHTQLIWRLGRYFLAGVKTVFQNLKDTHPNREDFLDACERGDVAGASAAILTFAEVRMNAYLDLLAELPARNSRPGCMS